MAALRFERPQMDREEGAMSNKNKRKKNDSKGRPQSEGAPEDFKWQPERRRTYQTNEDADRTKEWEDDK